MTHRTRFLAALLPIGLVLAPVAAQAHERDFTLLRDWFLPYRYEREIEYRYTHVKGGDFNMHQVEFEYGVSDHFAIEPGIAFVKEQGGKLHVDGYEMELRFNFGEFHTNRFLPALNLEFDRPVNRDEDDHAELKFILSRYDDYGNDLTINANIGWATNHRHQQESEIGIGYMHPSRPGMSRREPGWKYGAEFAETLVDHHAIAGPTVAYRANEHFHLLGTFAFGVNNRDDNTIKVIGEWEF
ncbi:MAG: hypothetical protein QOJ65_2238 [Fimbriimonadaceae bacterium]|jgi:hypothetical protein|nr:hypothetical protein [Fimbriimonadaceae bacterium]